MTPRARPAAAPRATASPASRTPRLPIRSPAKAAGPKTVTFTLDGEEVHAREGETIWQVAKRNGTDIPHLCYAPEPGYRPDGNCRACMVEIDGERVLAASCIRTPTAGMKVKSRLRPRQDRAKNGVRAADRGSARPQHAGARPGVEVLELGRPDRDRVEPPAGARKRSRARPQPRRDGGQSRRLHPVQSLRPRLPRSAGQRRDRHGGARPQRKDRVRLRRSDGPVDLRRLRRMRAGLPDRRADAVDLGEREQRPHRRAFPRPPGGQRVPVLRRRLPAHLQHQGRQAALRHRQARARRTRTGSA